MDLERLKAILARTSVAGGRQGTAFLIGRSYAVTCWHCLAGTNDDRPVQELAREVTLVFTSWPAPERKRAATLTAFDATRDVALLHLTAPAPDFVEPIGLAPATTNGAEWMTFAYPSQVGEDGTPLSGTVTDANARRFGAPAIQLALRQGRNRVSGASGAPVLAGGVIVGLLTDQLLERDATHQLAPALDAVYALPLARIADMLEAVGLGIGVPVAEPADLPPPPSLLIGREQCLADLKARLRVTPGGRQPGHASQALTVIRGLPGLGKTAVAAALAHDSDVAPRRFQRVVWVPMGERPGLVSVIASLGDVLRSEALLRASTLGEATRLLTRALYKKRILVMVDDVWRAEDAVPFLRAGGGDGAVIFTTRLPAVAEHIAADDPTAIYELRRLSDDHAHELLRALAPAVVADHPTQSRAVALTLEGLPLALLVAGRMLNSEHRRGFAVAELLTELQNGLEILRAKAPADRMDLATQTIPTVSMLLQKSTDRLDSHALRCFATLGLFPPKPAIFDEAALKGVWQVADAKPTARVLIDSGLLEPVGAGRFQLHALLVMHARSLLPPEYR